MATGSAKLSAAIADAEKRLSQLDEHDPDWQTINTLVTLLSQNQRSLDRLVKRSDATEAKLFDTNKSLEILMESLARFVPQTVVDALVEAGDDSVAVIRRRNLTVFFSDIVGFSTIATRQEPETLAKLLMDYFTAMSEVCKEYGGTLDQFIGDAMVIFFGDPKSKGVREDATAAVNMALDMQSRLELLRAKWKSEGFTVDVRTRMGISSGFCHVGNFGSETRLHYTAIGNAVNEAARLESLAEPDQIVITADTNALIEDTIETTAIGPADLKGRDHPVELFVVNGQREKGSHQLINVAGDGYSLVVDQNMITDKDETIKALRSAIDQLKSSGS